MSARAPRFTAAALANIEETGAQWQADVALLRDGVLSEAGLFCYVTDGAPDDREHGWIDYVVAVAAFAAERDAEVGK
jgi:hypothetical protein